MSGKEERETVRTQSVSCTRLEWERLRECARRERMSISRFVVERALHGDPGGSAGQVQDPALTGDGQRMLHDRVTALADLLLPLLKQADAQQPNLPNAMRVLFDMKLDEMTRTRRHREMTRLLATVFGDDRASQIAEEVRGRNCGH